MQLTRAFLGLSMAATITTALPVYQCGEAMCSNAEEYRHLQLPPALKGPYYARGISGDYRTEMEPIPGYTRNKQEDVVRVIGGRSDPKYYDDNFGKDSMMRVSASPGGIPRVQPSFRQDDRGNMSDDVKSHAGANVGAARMETERPEALLSGSKMKTPGTMSTFDGVHGLHESRDEKPEKDGAQEMPSTLRDGREGRTDSLLAGERFHKSPTYYRINFDNVQKRDHYTVSRPFDFSKPQGSLYDVQEHIERPVYEGDSLSHHQKRQDKPQQQQQQQKKQQQQQQQQQEQKQQEQKQQQVRPASHLLDCLTAAMGDIHQNTLCITSHFGRLQDDKKNWAESRY